MKSVVIMLNRQNIKSVPVSSEIEINKLYIQNNPVQPKNRFIKNNGKVLFLNLIRDIIVGRKYRYRMNISRIMVIFFLLW